MTSPAAPIRLYDLAAADARIRFSPYCWRVKMALAHKGLGYETVPWRFTEKEAIAPSGQGRVPVLIDGGRWLHDSWDIALYLDKAYPDRPRLVAPEAEGETLFIKHWAEAVLHPAVLPLVILDIHAILDPKDEEYFRRTREQMLGRPLEQASRDAQAELARVHAALEPLRRTLANQPYIGGGTPTFADYIPFGTLQWARCVSHRELVASDDIVFAWFDRMLSLYRGLGWQAPRAPAPAPADSQISGASA